MKYEIPEMLKNPPKLTLSQGEYGKGVIVNTSSMHGILGYPNGTAYQASRRVGLSGRDRVAIYGLGPVGLGGVLLAKAMGATVYGVDLVPVLDGQKVAGVVLITNIFDIVAQFIDRLTFKVLGETTAMGDAIILASKVAGPGHGWITPPLRGGKTGLIGFFVGQAMKKTGGRRQDA